MTVPYSNTSNIPQGLDTVTINSVDYVVDSTDLASKVNRIISRTDENGDRADFMIRAAAEPIEGTLTLQRASTSTALPPEGATFSFDFDRSNAASTLVVKDVKVNRSKDSFDIFDIGVVLVTYQS